MNANKTKTLKIKNKIKRKPRVKGKRLPNNRKRRANIIRGKKIAAASAKGFTKRFRMLRQNGNSVRVTGRDLIYSIPDDLTSPIQSTNVITIIPANPAYWKGTRIAALASGYQNYRPIMFKITYIPMCAVTQQGNVIGGTIWDDGIDNNNIQQSLRTSNGGFMTQCYVPHTTTIRPRTNLQFNLYRMGGEFSTTSNPFLFVALAIGCKDSNNLRITPGYFYVTWSFELKNPIGSINDYNNTGLITYADLKNQLNTTIININPNSDIPFGACINIEEEEGVKVPYYNETPIEITGTTPVWGFTSVSKNPSTRMLSKIPILYNSLTTNEKINVGDGWSAGYIVSDEGYYDIYIALGLVDKYVKIDRDDVSMLFNDIYQNFGEYQEDVDKVVQLWQGTSVISMSYTAHFRHYRASKDLYVTQIASNNVKKDENVNQIRIIKSLPITQEQPKIDTINTSTDNENCI